MKNLFVLFAIITFLSLTNSQHCLNHQGKNVAWWVMLIYPNSVSTGYAYFDSTMTTAKLVSYLEEPDTQGTPLWLTLNQINTLKMESIAWNDETPGGATSSSKAHSKSVYTYLPSTNLGFIYDHSIPKYPAFIGSQINITIPSQQSIYGQHSLCISANTTMIEQITPKMMITTPYYYANTLQTPTLINDLINSGKIGTPNYKDLFQYSEYTLNSTQAKFIHKGGKLNGSIFEDGLNNMLNSSIIAETWGRPIQDPWCGKISVGNVVSLNISSTIGWKQTQDHSKWAYAVSNNFSCFGDMNRMTSQWKRGGTFYCLNSSPLNKALKSIVTSTNVCS